MAKIKPLNQEAFKMKILKDLGMVPNKKGINQRMAIFECLGCHKGFKANVMNSKKREYCNDCSKKESDKKKRQPLKQCDYKMKLIADLGNIPKQGRCAIFECNDCKKHFRVRVGSTASKNQTKCKDCSFVKHRRTDSQLYAVWNGIKQRCYSPNRKDYQKYGGIGVTMCEEWVDNPAAFIEFCERNGWKKGLQVDKDIKCRELNISPAIYAPHTISFVTQAENSTEASAKVVIQMSPDKEFIAEFPSVVEASRKTEVCKTSIARVARGVQHTAGGYKWKYKS